MSLQAIESWNKQPVHNSFIMFPPEILSLVCGLLPKSVLKQVRQVSRIWERAAVPDLFDKVFISQDMTDFRIAKLVIHQFRHYIRTLVFSSIYYRRFDRGSFGSDWARGSCMNIDTDDAGHTDHALEFYRFMRNKQQESIMRGTSSAYLSFALTRLPNVRKIILTDTSSSRSMPPRSLQVYQPQALKSCPFEQCDLTDAEHLPYAAWASGFTRKGSANPWRLVLSALSTTHANVRELTMEPDDMYLSTDTAAFSMSPYGLSQAILTFQNLTKLRLSLIGDIEGVVTDVATPHVRNIAKLLNNAINLESLSLDQCDEEIGPPFESLPLQQFLGQCKFPKLRSLILAYFTSSDEELLRLLNHSKRLEQIAISHLTLAKGSWMRVADWIRASLPLLKHAELSHLYGGFYGPITHRPYVDRRGDVGNFLFASGENPFTKEALGKAGQYMFDRDEYLDHVDAYTKYH